MSDTKHAILAYLWRGRGSCSCSLRRCSSLLPHPFLRLVRHGTSSADCIVGSGSTSIGEIYNQIPMLDHGRDCGKARTIVHLLPRWGLNYRLLLKGPGFWERWENTPFPWNDNSPLGVPKIDKSFAEWCTRTNSTLLEVVHCGYTKKCVCVCSLLRNLVSCQAKG